jgi:hypothetical protein
VSAFLSGKRVYESSEEFTIIRLFGSKEKHFLLPFYTLDKLFVGQVCLQYKTWDHLFHDKREKKFIPLPWKVVLNFSLITYVKHLINTNFNLQ